MKNEYEYRARAIKQKKRPFARRVLWALFGAYDWTLSRIESVKTFFQYL